MDSVITNFITSYGLIAIFLLMFSNGLLSAPPSELVLAISGIWSVTNQNLIIPIFLFALSGNVIGAITLYVLGKVLGIEWITEIKIIMEKSNNKLIQKSSRFIPNALKIESYAEILRKKGFIWVGIFRFFPVVRSIVSFPAGMIRMQFFKFLSISILGMSIWISFWIAIGIFLKYSWINYENKIFMSGVVTLCLLVLCLYIIIKKTIKKKFPIKNKPEFKS